MHDEVIRVPGDASCKEEMMGVRVSSRKVLKIVEMDVASEGILSLFVRIVNGPLRPPHFFRHKRLLFHVSSGKLLN